MKNYKLQNTNYILLVKKFNYNNSKYNLNDCKDIK